MKRPWSSRLSALLLACVVLPGTLGLQCAGLPFVQETVDIELINLTDYEVDPFIYIDPDNDVSIDDLFVEDNFFPVEPPLAVDELATFTFDCADVGTVASDFAWMLISDEEAIESDNGPIVTEGLDFTCGDVVSFIFIDDGVDFYTRVEINGVFLTDR